MIESLAGYELQRRSLGHAPSTTGSTRHKVAEMDRCYLYGCNLSDLLTAGREPECRIDGWAAKGSPRWQSATGYMAVNKRVKRVAGDGAKPNASGFRMSAP